MKGSKTKKIELQYTTIQSPVPDFMYEELKRFVQESNTYHLQPQELISTLSKKHGVPAEMFFLTAGINEAIHLLAVAYGENTFTFTPTYIEYLKVKDLRRKLTEQYSIQKDEFKISTTEIPTASLIFLANPNNPFGFTPKKDVLELVTNNPRAIVVIDEAYGEFADLSVADEVQKHSNLVVLRSFSKSYSLAGFRIGYAIGSKEVVTRLTAVAPWANVSYPAVGAAIIALQHEDYFIKMRDSLNTGRKDLEKFLKKSGLSVFESKINAASVKFNSKKEAYRFVTHLESNNITVNQGNGVANMGLDDSFVRIAIGTPEQMEIVKNAIAEF